MKRKIFRYLYRKASPNSLKWLLGGIYGVTELAGWIETARLLKSISGEVRK